MAAFLLSSQSFDVVMSRGEEWGKKSIDWLYENRQGRAKG